jgi:hypothetical protein
VVGNTDIARLLFGQALGLPPSPRRRDFPGLPIAAAPDSGLWRSGQRPLAL